MKISKGKEYMMNKQQIMEHIDIVKKYHSRNAEEISDALDMLNYSLEELSNKTRDEQTRALKNKDFTKGDGLWELSKFVSTVQSEISEYSAALLCGEDTEDDDAEQSEEQITVPDYSRYTVDSAIPHTFSESFTHKKITVLQIMDQRFDVKDWKDALIQTCNYLIDLDKSRFIKMTGDPVMKGRKISYFGKDLVDRKNAKIKNSDLYVWTNLSADSTKKLIKKMLMKYGIRIADCRIFLRADYSPLHMEQNG